MSAESRKLQEGDLVTTDFSRLCKGIVFRIVKRYEGQASLSTVTFFVSPIVPGSNGMALDADWFEPAINEE
jgi:hypothetical protein